VQINKIKDFFIHNTYNVGPNINNTIMGGASVPTAAALIAQQQ
jgi:hypothetical protein